MNIININNKNQCKIMSIMLNICYCWVYYDGLTLELSRPLLDTRSWPEQAKPCLAPSES